MEIPGKVAVVSGGGSGIGRATVLALVERGAKVVVADIDEDAGRQTVTLAAAKGGTAIFARCDVTKTDELAGAFALAVEHFGRLHIAFNNAGIGGENLFADDPGDWAHIIDIDLTAVIDATRIAVREMQRNGEGGVIINAASVVGLGPFPVAPVYAAAKAGVVNFSRSLAHLAEESNIRVNAICPELVDTPMAHGVGQERLEQLRIAGRILMPEDIAAGVIELVEDDSRAGAVMRLTVGGGREYATTDTTPRRHIRVRVLKPAAVYFALVFGTGFVLGIVRLLWGVPRLGTRIAELLEMPLMLVAIVLAARWTTRHVAADSGPRARLVIGAMALGLLITAEVVLAVALRGVSVTEALVDRDPVSGMVYYALLGVFALLPWLLGRRSDVPVRE